jgi:pyruvate formate lyase activating enzyme
MAQAAVNPGEQARPAERIAPQPAGYIYNIMRYSTQDGPGIRTTLFFKGCSLRCWWCHNPESQEAGPQLLYFADRCLGCGDCIPVCPESAIDWEDGHVAVSSACRACATCVETCVASAREVVGRWMSVAETLAEIEKDIVFYDQSGGGVTFSGGEPLLQPRFLEALLDACRARGIHSIVDTSGFAPADVLARFIGKADLFYYDLKFVDAEKHRKYIGAPNDVILANLERLAGAHAPVVVRIPVIAGVNDDDRETAAMAALLARLGLKRVYLLPYHKIGIEKYRRLGIKYRLDGLEPPPLAQLERIAGHMEARGLSVQIGGAS